MKKVNVEEAEKAAEIYSKQNRSDPHAYNRAYSRIMNGIFTCEDFFKNTSPRFSV